MAKVKIQSGLFSDISSILKKFDGWMSKFFKADSKNTEYGIKNDKPFKKDSSEGIKDLPHFTYVIVANNPEVLTDFNPDKPYNLSKGDPEELKKVVCTIFMKITINDKPIEEKLEEIPYTEAMNTITKWVEDKVKEAEDESEEESTIEEGDMEDVDEDMWRGNAAESRRLKATLKKVTSSTGGEDIVLTKVNANYSSIQAMNDLEFALNDEDFSDSIMEDEISFELVCNDEDMNIEVLPEMPDDNGLPQIIKTCLKSITALSTCRLFVSINDPLYSTVEYWENKFREHYRLLQKHYFNSGELLSGISDVTQLGQYMSQPEWDMCEFILGVIQEWITTVDIYAINFESGSELRGFFEATLLFWTREVEISTCQD